jgi:Family of unknown function (DUF6011)
MTARQLDFIKRLYEERVLPFDAADEHERGKASFARKVATGEQHGTGTYADRMTPPQASRLIEWLMGLPRRESATTSAAAEPAPDVPAGRFALATNGDPTLRFFKVDRPEEGRWAGRTFLSEIFGGGYGDDGRREPIRDRARRTEILNAILAVGPMKAAQCYGIELGHCGRCGRTLTDETSRAFGIGPDCREAWGI